MYVHAVSILAAYDCGNMCGGTSVLDGDVLQRFAHSLAAHES